LMIEPSDKSALPVRSVFRNYWVEFSGNWLESLGRLLEPEKTFVVCDERVRSLWDSELAPFLKRRRHLLLSPSEESKTLDGAQQLIAELIESGVRRDHTVLAIGGGITQDVAAFAASILYRGIEWAFLPTTLLAQADSCIGSKTSINVGDKKNLLGSFWPPTVALIDLRFLDTLTESDIRSGIGEILHFFLFANSPLTRPLVSEHAMLLTDRHRLEPYVRESLRIKRDVVERDEFDRDERHKFNYGHTFGHALESLTGYKLPHGQAVTVGMDIANFVSVKLGLMSMATFDDVHSLLAVNFPARMGVAGEPDRYCGYLGKDKKNLGGNVGCVLAERPGVLVTRQIPLDGAFKDIITEYFEGALWPA
jgi:3-dehydroquinate synthase